MTDRPLDRETAMGLLSSMRKIRQFEERIIPIYPTDVMVTPVHLHIGQEAVPAGVCAHLKPEDALFFGHRTHGPALAKGLDMKKLMAELYGRTTGCARGFGGSMHLVDPANGMFGSSSIVGGSIALGVGSALVAKLRKERRIAVSYFGDGATNSGVFWESMNFAALKKVPILFLCENNHLSNTMRQSEHLFVEDIMLVTEKFMQSYAADGTDVLDVYQKAGEAVQRVRSGGGPVFLECKTKRWMKHQGIEVDDLSYNAIDRKKDCPIHKLEQWMLQRRMATEEDFEQLRRRINGMIDEAVDFATKSPFPDENDLTKEV